MIGCARKSHEIIIFGGNGFLGRHFTERLYKVGISALIVSRSPDREFIAPMMDKMSTVSVEDFLANEMVFVSEATSFVYLASTSVPATHRNEPWRELEDNSAPAFELIARLVKINPKLRVVLLSSGGTVYGGDYSFPIPENTPLSPISPYGLGKVVTEGAMEFLGRSVDLDFAILRVANPIGRWQRNANHGIFNVALKAAKNGEVLRLYDGGTQIRDFLDADDVAEAILSAVTQTQHSKKIWNVGSGVGYAIRQVVEEIEMAIGAKIKIENERSRGVDVAYSVLDCRKIHQDLGWRATTPLRESLRKIISFD